MTRFVGSPDQGRGDALLPGPVGSTTYRVQDTVRFTLRRYPWSSS